jgi:hypothetical protein
MGLAKFYLKEGFYWLDLGDDVSDMVFKEMESIIAILKRTGKSNLSIEDILVIFLYREPYKNRLKGVIKNSKVRLKHI